MAATGRLAFFLLLSCLSLGGLAFNPTWTLEEPVGFHANHGNPHTYITGEAVREILRSYFGVATFTARDPPGPKAARLAIEDASAIVDDPADPAGEAEDSACHFNDDDFFRGNARLISKKWEIMAALSSNNVPLAQELLGRALHTVQDFYAHSNWVELGTGGISQNLGKSWPLEIAPASELDPLVPTCKACTGYTGDAGRDAALAAADTCRNSTSVAAGHPLSGAGQELPQLCMWSTVERPVCSANLDVPPDTTHSPPRLLTSGWFGTNHTLRSHKPKGKCSHGGPRDRDADGLEGINKDTFNNFFSPHSDLHMMATQLAMEASVKYIHDLKDVLCLNGGGFVWEPKDCYPLRKLFGTFGPPLAFAIDVSPGMSHALPSIRKEVVTMVMSRLGQHDEPAYYALIRINGYRQEKTLIAMGAYFIEVITNLSAESEVGGPDCPEFSRRGTLMSDAIEWLLPGTIMHVWTNAVAEDENRAQELAKAASAKQITIYTYLFDNPSCPGTETDALSVLSAGTGGQSFPNLSGADVPRTALLGRLLADSTRVLLAAYRHPLGGSNNPHPQGDDRGPQFFTHEIPLRGEYIMGMLTIVLSTTKCQPGTSLRLIRPDGSEALPSQENVTMSAVSSGVVLSVVAPAGGVWGVQVRAAAATSDGSSSVSLTAIGASLEKLDRFDFVENRGGQHDGWFPVKTTPAPGSEVWVVAAHRINLLYSKYEFRALDGRLLAGPDMAEMPGLGAIMDYGRARIPDEPFNVYIYYCGRPCPEGGGGLRQRMLPGILSWGTPAVANSSAGVTTGTTSVTASSSPTSSLPTTTSSSATPASATTTSTSSSPTPSSSTTTPSSTMTSPSATPPSPTPAAPSTTTSLSTSRGNTTTPSTPRSQSNSTSTSLSAWNHTIAATTSSASTQRQSPSTSTSTTVTMLTQTVIYYSSCEVEPTSAGGGSTISFSTATKTALMTYPCFESCDAPPPTLTPGYCSPGRPTAGALAGGDEEEMPELGPTAVGGSGTGAGGTAGAGKTAGGTAVSTARATTGTADAAKVAAGSGSAAKTAGAETATPKPTTRVVSAWARRVDSGGSLRLLLSVVLGVILLS